MPALLLYVLLLIHVFICCLFSLFLLSRFCHKCFPLLSFVYLSSSYFENKFIINLFVYFPFCWALFHFLFLRVRLFSSNFPFKKYSHVLLNILLFLFSFSNVFSSVAPFSCISFFETLPGLIIVFVSFFIFSFYILSLFSQNAMFFSKKKEFRLYCLFFFWKNMFLVRWSLKGEKSSSVFSLSSCFLFLKKNLKIKISYFFFTFFFEHFTFSKQVWKLHVLCYSVFFQFFLSSVFHVVSVSFILMSFTTWFF